MGNDIIQLDPIYKNLIQALKDKVQSARMKAIITVNTAQTTLYWEIGRVINEQQANAKWGSKVLDQISHDLQSAFPDMKGFSRSNMHYMKQFAAAYPTTEIVQQPVGQLPWGHIIVLIQKVKDKITRNWYAKQAVENNWARAALERHIKNDLYSRQGQEEIKQHLFCKFQNSSFPIYDSLSMAI